jgi:hypothetical protein
VNGPSSSNWPTSIAAVERVPVRFMISRLLFRTDSDVALSAW